MTHPARVMPFEQLYDGLLAEVKAGMVKEQYAGNLRLYCYTRHCAYERAWNPITELARGHNEHMGGQAQNQHHGVDGHADGGTERR